MVVPLGHLGEDVRAQVLREADAQNLQHLKEAVMLLLLESSCNTVQGGPTEFYTGNGSILHPVL